MCSLGVVTLSTAWGQPPLAAPTTAPKAPAEPPAAPPGVAVVEMFTSEGCSSCPPADAVLARLRAEAAKDGTPVYAMAFHVDYWDRLGWPDRFASAAATKRQRAYAAALGDGVYTPQAIINGAAPFVGADRLRARLGVARAPRTPVQTAVLATIAPRASGGPIAVAVQCAGAPAGAMVVAALVEDGLVTDVRAGENADRKLVHEGVVRVFAEAKLGQDRAASLTLTPPAGVDERRASVVVFAQEAGMGAVLGATGQPLAGTVAAGPNAAGPGEAAPGKPAAEPATAPAPAARP